MKLDELDKAALVTCVALLAFTALLFTLSGCGIEERAMEGAVGEVKEADPEFVAFDKAMTEYVAAYKEKEQAGFEYLKVIVPDTGFVGALTQFDAAAYEVAVWEFMNQKNRRGDPDRDYRLVYHERAWAAYIASAFEVVDLKCSLRGRNIANLATTWLTKFKAFQAAVRKTTMASDKLPRVRGTIVATGENKLLYDNAIATMMGYVPEHEDEDNILKGQEVDKAIDSFHETLKARDREGDDTYHVIPHIADVPDETYGGCIKEQLFIVRYAACERYIPYENRYVYDRKQRRNVLNEESCPSWQENHGLEWPEIRFLRMEDDFDGATR